MLDTFPSLQMIVIESTDQMNIPSQKLNRNNLLMYIA